MELRHLRYFLAVAEEGHFGRAAEKLHIVQPAQSMQIQSLEEELGGLLFKRTSRRVVLTEAGIAFQLEAARTIAQADRAKRSAQQAMRGEAGRVRLGFAGNAISTGKLSDDLRVFNQTHASVELELHHMASRSQAEAILEERLDVGYAPSFGVEFAPQLLAEQIGKWPWVVGMMHGHPLASRTSLTTSSLVTEPFVLYAGPDNDRAQAAILRDVLGFEPHIAYRVPDTLSVLALASAGLGITLVPAPLSSMSVPNVVYRALEDADTCANLVLISRKGETSGAVRAFLEVARQGCASLEAGS